MTTVVFLIVAGVLTRFLPHLPNAVPLAAITLYAGARLSRPVAIAVPLLILAVSDLYISWVTGYQFYSSQLVGYGFFAALAIAAGFVPKKAGPITRVGMSALGSTAFFLVSNFAVWVEGSGLGFPRTLPGLIAVYEAGFLFYVYQLLTDLIGTGVLFGLEGFVGRVWSRMTVLNARPVPIVVDDLPSPRH